MIDIFKYFPPSENPVEQAAKGILFGVPLVLWLQAAIHFRLHQTWIDELKKPRWFIGRKPMPFIWLAVYGALALASYRVFEIEGWYSLTMAYYASALFVSFVSRHFLLRRHDVRSAARIFVVAFAFFFITHGQFAAVDDLAGKLLVGVCAWHAYVLSVIVPVAIMNKPDEANENEKSD